MYCPFCSSSDTKVVDSRVNELEVRRRRECIKCSKRFTTYEKAELELTVIKKDGRKEPFDRSKIERGLVLSCNKTPVTEEQIEAITDKVEMKVRNLNKEEVKSAVIGNMITKELLKKDRVAYLRFVSVYKGFDHPKMFAKEVALLKD